MIAFSLKHFFKNKNNSQPTLSHSNKRNINKSTKIDYLYIDRQKKMFCFKKIVFIANSLAFSLNEVKREIH